MVNCTLQDPNDPLTYLRTEDLAAFRPGSLIVDVSCDEGMGFSWAQTTTFAEPMFTVGDHIDYYAVDHSPSYLWNSASWEISEALLPFLETVIVRPGGLGRRTRPSAAPSKSATAWSSTRTCWSSSSAQAEYPHALPERIPATGAPRGRGSQPLGGGPLTIRSRRRRSLRSTLSFSCTVPGQDDGDRHRGERRHPAGHQQGGVRVNVLGDPADHRARRWPGRRSAP